MPRLTRTVATGNQPAAWGYVQLTLLAGEVAGDFQAKVRADEEVGSACTRWLASGVWLPGCPG